MPEVIALNYILIALHFSAKLCVFAFQIRCAEFAANGFVLGKLLLQTGDLCLEFCNQFACRIQRLLQFGFLFLGCNVLFRKRRQAFKILTLHGNIELGPIVGMTDRIVDITATGTTLRENDLVIVDDVMECTARFFAGPAAYRCDKRIRDLAARLAEVSATTKEA